MTHATGHRVSLAFCLLGCLEVWGSCSSAPSSPTGGGDPTPGGGGATAASSGGRSGSGGASAPAGTGGGVVPGSGGGALPTPGSGGATGTGGQTGVPPAGTGGRGSSASGGQTPASTGGVGGSGTSTATGGAGGTPAVGSGLRPFPQNVRSASCTYPSNAKAADVVAAYDLWKTTTVTADGAGGFLRVKKPDSGTVIGSTVSEGIGYGMLLAVYMGDQALFDGLWKYSQLHLDAQGFMNWEISPTGTVTAGGNGGATDGDEDIAWALVMADKQWGGRGTLSDTYLNLAKKMIDIIWLYEIDHGRGEMVKPGNQWGDVDTTNPSYFAPAYYRVFGQVTGKTADWNKVVDSSYTIISKSLNAANGNASNGLVPAWCTSAGVPVAQGGVLGFQNDATRTPFRVGQDYCYFGEPRAKAYLAKISAFYAGVGVNNIINGYALNGTPQPEKPFPAGLQAASFVGPAAVGAMSDPQYQTFVNDGYALVATQKLTAGTIYYQKSWAALSLLMLSGNFIDFTAR